jgi:hypothetical protein
MQRALDRRTVTVLALAGIGVDTSLEAVELRFLEGEASGGPTSQQRGLRVREVAHAPRWEVDMTLKQACSRWVAPPRAPGAFKDLMTHVLQFALRIAFRCVLHRRKSQDIRC